MPAKKPVRRGPSYAGLKIRLHRIRMGMSQRELAEKTGTDPGQIARYETGEIWEPRRDTLERIAKATGQPAIEFIEGAGGEVPDNWEIGLLADPSIPDNVKQSVLTLINATRPGERKRA